MPDSETMLFSLTTVPGVFAAAVCMFIRQKNIPVQCEEIKGNEFFTFLVSIVVLNFIELIDYIFNITGGEDAKTESVVLFAVYLVVFSFAWVFVYFTLINVGASFTGTGEKKSNTYIFVIIASVQAMIQILTELGIISIAEDVYYNLIFILNEIMWVLAAARCINDIRLLHITGKKTLSSCMVFYLAAFLMINIADSITFLSLKVSEAAADAVTIVYLIFWLMLGLVNIWLVWNSYDTDFLECKSDKVNEEKLAAFSALYGLSDREKEIVRAIYEGKRITQIAEELQLSENTVRVHNYRLYKKLEVEDRVQAANKIRSEL